MAIERMKRLRLLGLREDRDKLLSELMRLSCVEISRLDARVFQSEKDGRSSERAARGADGDSGVSGAGDSANGAGSGASGNGDGGQEALRPVLLREKAGAAELSAQRTEMRGAIDTLQRYAHIKKNLFAPRRRLRERELMSVESLSEARRVSQEIREQAARIAALTAEEGRLQNRRAMLLPWRTLALPLSALSSEHCALYFGVCPASADCKSLQDLLAINVAESELFLVSSDQEQHYLMFMCHSGAEEEAMALLKTFGFSRMQFKDVTGTAASNISRIEARLGQIEEERRRCEDNIIQCGPALGVLECAVDALTIAAGRAEAAERSGVTHECFYMEGWVAAHGLSRLERILARYDLAVSLSEPAPEDDVPILLRNTKLMTPFNMVTEMYSLPAYNGVDPNPLMGPFFALFFGIMFADVAYGLVLLLLGLMVTRRIKPRGMAGNLFKLMAICGCSAMFFGVLFGGFFGDAIDAVARGFFGYSGQRSLVPALWFSPMEDPMKMLVFSLILGAVQILVGMVIKAVMLIREGRWLDALFDVGSWWVVFVGIALLATGGTYWVAVAGAASLILTQGRSAKGFFGKLAGGIGSLYDITAYASDVLSYSRLMALGLASGVIAQVFNTLGVMTGPIFFILVFVVGHAFNMGVNIIGTYVHTARLQYLEYFSKFYREGGTAFKPLTLDTQYVDLIRED